MGDSNTFGMLAEFDTPRALYHACEKVRDEGFSRWDAHSPFAVHGLDGAMGLKSSIMPWIVLVCGLAGTIGGFLMQTWVHNEAYPLIYSAKPLWAWQAYIPVTFECGVLFACFGAVFGMFHVNRLPTLYHPLFNSERFAAVTDDKFFISIEAADPQYDEARARSLLEEAGATHIEVLEN